MHLEQGPNVFLVRNISSDEVNECCLAGLMKMEQTLPIITNHKL